MRRINKFIVAFMAAIMAFAMVPFAFADEETPTTNNATSNNTHTITITSPSEVSDDAESVYTIKKVFDATADDKGNIRYTVMSGKQVPITDKDAKEKLDVDTAGNVGYYKLDDKGDWQLDKTATTLSQSMIDAIATYVEKDTAVATVKITGPSTEGYADVPYGYYFISTTTGTVVTIDSTNPRADVKDKNKMTTVVKSAGTEYDAASLKAIQQAGQPQSFAAQITLGKGATKVVFTDTMTDMTYVDKSLAIKVEDKDVTASNYTLVVSENAAGFTVTFKDEYIHGLSEGTIIKLTYKGMITSAGLSVNPAKNKATVTSGNDGQFSDDSEEVDVYNAKFTVTKQDGTDKKALAGAGFVIKNAKGNYYKLADDNYTVSWVEQESDATEYKSDSNGAVTPFTGLADGTYTLVEKTVPTGYNKVADSTFTITGNDYTVTNLEQEATVENFKGTELPSTGGIGTTIFYVVGGVMVAGAVIFLLTKRRMSVSE